MFFKGSRPPGYTFRKKHTIHISYITRQVCNLFKTCETISCASPKGSKLSVDPQTAQPALGANLVARDFGITKASSYNLFNTI